MSFKSKIAVALISLLTSFSVLAVTPSINLYQDVTDPNPQKFNFSVRAGNTPVITVYCQVTNSIAYTNFGTGWSPEFNYFQKDSASAGVTLSGTLTPSTGVIVFNALTNTFPAQGSYFAEVYLHNGTDPKLTIAQGQLTVTRSPSSGSFGSLNLYNRINWDIISNQGTVPWAAGAEPVFYASAAYGITATQTSNWTIAYTHSQADTVTSNTGNWAGTWGGLTTNAISTTTSVASVEADVAALKGKTSGWDTAETDSSVATNFIGTNTFQAQITANLTNQNATNVLLLASTVSLQSQVTANLTNQNSTNTLLQSQISAATSTNTFTAFQTNQIATNLLLLTQITTDRTNQVATNAWFQAYHTAQVTTNAWFQYWFGLQADSNTYFQGLFDTEVTSNALLQAQISTNLNDQTLTNTLFESRITSNETFRITTQPATNAAFSTLINNYYTNQNASNTLLQTQITANLTNQNASNTVYLGWHTNQVNSNVIYSSYDDRITSNSTWKVGTNDSHYTDAITNESLWIAVSNKTIYTNTSLYLSLFSSTGSLQSQVTANLTNQNATNALLRTAIDDIDSSGWARALFTDGSKSINYLNVANTNYLGANIVTNGTFTGSASNWSLSTFFYQVNRVILNPSLSGSIEYTNAMVITTNKLYQLTLETMYGNAAITATVGGVSYTWPSATETHTAYFNAITDGKIIIGASTGTNSLEIDNVTLKECPTGSVFVAQDVKVGNSVIARVGIYAPNIGSISTDVDTVEALASGHTTQIGSISNVADAAKAIADGLNARSSTWDTVTSKADQSDLTGLGNSLTNTINFATDVSNDLATAEGLISTHTSQIGAISNDLDIAEADIVTSSNHFETRVDNLDSATGALNSAVSTLQIDTNSLQVQITTNYNLQSLTNALHKAWINTNLAFNVSQLISNLMYDAQIGTNTAFNVEQALSNLMFSAWINTNTDFNVAQALTNVSVDARIETNTDFNVAQALTNTAIDGRMTGAETGKVDYVNATYTSTVGLAASAVQRTGDTNVIDLSSADYILIPESTRTNSPINRDEFIAAIDSIFVLKLYGDTNAHPVIGGGYSLTEEVPSAWTNTIAFGGDSNFVVGIYWFTNSTARIRDGGYVGMFFAEKTAGSKDVTAKIQLVYTDDDGASTNTIGDESVGVPITTLITYQMPVVNPTSITNSTLYLGIQYSLEQSGIGNNATVNTYGGAGYNTHLATPGVGDRTGYLTSESDPLAVKLAGDIMTGPMTNTAGIYGNGVGLTNVSGTGGDVYLASNNTFAAGTTNRMPEASVGRIEIETTPGDVGTYERYITREEDRLKICNNSALGSYFSVGTNALWFHFKENEFECKAPLTVPTISLGGTNLATSFDNLFAATQSLDTAVGEIKGRTNSWNVVATQHFAGAATTGLVTSAAGDAAKFLKGDGTWDDTPAASYGITDSTGYRGDWGNALTGEVTQLKLDTNTINAAMFRKDGSVAMTGDFNGGGQAATNIASLQITGSSPTNGAVWIATNVLGEGKWSLPVAFAVTFTTNNYIPTGAHPLIYDDIVFNYGNHFDGQVFTAPVNGYYSFSMGGLYVAYSGDAAPHVKYDIKKNGTSVGFCGTVYARKIPDSAGQGDGINSIACQYLTNGARIKTEVNANSGLNYLPLGDFWFTGALIRELP